MILGLGVDIVHLPDFENRLDDTLFVDATFTMAERAYSNQQPAQSRKNQSYASRFAAKEAFIKAFDMARGTRFDKLALESWKSIEVSMKTGFPVMHVSEMISEKLNKMGVTSIHLSLSHDGPSVIGLVILEST